MTPAPASADLHYPSGHTQPGQPVIKTEAEHIGDQCGLETETEESGEESETEDRLKTEGGEGGKEASTSKPPFSYVAMIGECREANKGLFLESEYFFFNNKQFWLVENSTLELMLDKHTYPR